MYRNIYLIRHSEQLKLKGKKHINEESNISNEKIILSIDGERKAEDVSKLDCMRNIDLIWCSNYVRAIATSKYIAYENNININIDERLNERKLR